MQPPAFRRRRGAALTLRFLGDLERSNRFTLAMKDVRIKVLQAREAATALQLARFAQLTAVVGQLTVRAGMAADSTGRLALPLEADGIRAARHSPAGSFTPPAWCGPALRSRQLSNAPLAAPCLVGLNPLATVILPQEGICVQAGERKALAEQESRRWHYNKRGLVAGGTLSRSQALPPDPLQPAKPGAAAGPGRGAGEGRAGKGQPAAAAGPAGAGGLLPGCPAGTGRLGSTAARPSPADAAAGKQGAAAAGTGKPGAPLPAESASPGATLHREFKPAKPQPKDKDVTPLAKALEYSSKDFAALEPDADDAVVLEDGRQAPRCVLPVGGCMAACHQDA